MESRFKSFLLDRLIRLGIPLLIYDLLLDPLVVYIASGLHGSYWSFYGNYLLHEKGIANGPVWFIAVLLVFTLVYAAWRVLSRHRTQTTAGAWKLPGYRAIFCFIFLLGLVSFVGRIWWPAGWIFQLLNVPVGYLPQYISLYILGLIAYRRNWFIKLSQDRKGLVSNRFHCYSHLRLPGVSFNDASFGGSWDATG